MKLDVRKIKTYFKFSSRPTENTLPLHYNTNRLILYKEINSVLVKSIQYTLIHCLESTLKPVVHMVTTATGALSRKHCFSGKARSITYSECVCCSLSYPACNAHASYCHLWSVQLYNIFPQYLIKGTIWGQELLNTKRVF